MNASQKAARLKLMAFDVDGVLTDGSLYFTPNGDEIKAFSSLDGHGLKMLMEAGLQLAIITGRKSQAVALRAQNLGIQYLYQAVHDKRSTLIQLCQELKIGLHEAGYMGDDVVDLPILRNSGFSATVNDGHDFVKKHVDYVARGYGGRGAVREVCDFILTAQGKLEAMHNAYLQD